MLIYLLKTVFKIHALTFKFYKNASLLQCIIASPSYHTCLQGQTKDKCSNIKEIGRITNIEKSKKCYFSSKT